MTEPTKEQYYEASWHTIVSIAMEQYGMSPHTASIYAWVIFGRMTSKDYKKLVH